MLIDTGPLIMQLRKYQPTVQLLRLLAHRDNLAVSAMTRVELRARMQPEERYATLKLLSRFATMAVDHHVADRAGDLANLLRLRGINIGLADTIIAATALQHDLTLLTFNQKDFARVPGLRLYPLPSDE